MVIRKYTPKDKARVSDLMAAWGLEYDVMEYASDLGFVVVSGGGVQGACFLFTTNSPLCWVDHFVVNKEMNKKDRELAIDMLIAAVTMGAQQSGAMAIIAEPRFTRSYARLKKHGYKEFKAGRFWKGF